MLIEFSVANFRSFNKIQTVSFRATGLVSEDKSVDELNIVDIADIRMLKTIGVYGPNASGKSNIVKAIRLYREMIAFSMISEDLTQLVVDPFKLSTEESSDAGFFQSVIILDEKKYRYGFTLSKDGNISGEWLFGPAEKNETYYFKRKDQKIDINPERFAEGVDNPLEKLRPNALFLSFCSSFNGPVSGSIRRFFHHDVFIEGNIGSKGKENVSYRIPYWRTNQLIENGNKHIVLDWMHEIGLHYEDVQLERSQLKETLTNDVIFAKNKYDQKGKSDGIAFMRLNEESDGTKKFYSFIGELQEKFDKGGLYICDEIDSNFHPTLLQHLIRIFNNHLINKANAQLLFTSHDTNLMDPAIMRRDQFYFTEKSQQDETILYALSDLKGIRNNADFARQYLAGFYGAIPLLSNCLEKDNE